MNSSVFDTKSELATLADYKIGLDVHDWGYDYSDDRRAWTQGRVERGWLQAVQKRLDPVFTVWNSIAPLPYRATNIRIADEMAQHSRKNSPQPQDQQLKDSND